MAITPVTTSDPVSPLETLFNTGYTQIAADIAAVSTVRQIHSFKWANTAARTAQAGMTEGDEGYQLDTDILYRYNGAAWVSTAASPAGLIPIIPTSVSGTGVVLGSGGKVTFTSATTVGINGCFTTSYDNYVIVITVPTTSASLGVLMALRVSGTDTTTNYDTQALFGFASTAGASQTIAGANWNIGGTNLASIHDGEVKLYAPRLAEPTRGLANFSSLTNPMTAAATSISQQKAILQRSTTAFDGFSLAASTGNMSGAARVYAYANN